MNRVLLFFLLYTLFFSKVYALVNDDFVNKSLSNDLKKPEINLSYDYSSTQKIPIKLVITTPIKSQKELWEGRILNFVVKRNVFYKSHLLIKANTPVTARVEMVIENGMNGIPASVILGNFEIQNIEKSRLSMDYEKFGLDLSLLVFPLKWALTPLPPLGSLTNFIKGGNVKIKGSDEITIYYYPNWF